MSASTPTPGPTSAADRSAVSQSQHSSSRTLSEPTRTVDPDLEAQEPEKGLERQYSHRSQREVALEKGANPDNTPLAKDDPDRWLVTLKGREHLNPHTWGVKYRWFLTVFAGVLVLNATFASSAPSNLIPSIIVHFGVSEEVGILLIAIFVAGYCLGPLVSWLNRRADSGTRVQLANRDWCLFQLWGPLSERYGRKYIFVGSFVPYTLFQMACGLAPNIGSLIAFRFLGGCFAAAPLTNVSACYLPSASCVCHTNVPLSLVRSEE